MAAVKQHEMGLPAGDIARKLGIAEQTFYRWKKQYGGLEATEVRETHATAGGECQTQEAGGGAQLGQGDAAGDCGKKVVSAPERRAVVRYLCGQYGISERHACRVVQVSRATVRYQARRTVPTGPAATVRHQNKWDC